MQINSVSNYQNIKNGHKQKRGTQKQQDYCFYLCGTTFLGDVLS